MWLRRHQSGQSQCHPMIYWGWFSADQVGRNVVLEPATIFDMVGKDEIIKPTLEVIYDKV